MDTIEILVRNKIPRLRSNSLKSIITWNTDYIINFDFDEEWDETKTIRIVDDKSNLIEDKIFTGNSVQNGTPTPETPVEVESVGEKTANLINWDLLLSKETITKVENGYYSTGYSIAFNNNTDILKQIKSVLKPDTTYTLSRVYDGALNASNGFIFLRLSSNKDIGLCPLGRGLKSKTFSLTQEEIDSIQYIIFCFGGTITNLQVTESDTVLPYEPYGYKIPIKVSGKNLFDINNPVYGAVSSNNFNRKPKIENGVIRFYTWHGIAGGAGFMVPVPPNAEFTVSFDVIEGEFISEIISSNNGIDDEGIMTDFVRLTPQYTNVNKITYTQPSDKHYICILLDCVGGYFKCGIRNLQVELGSIATEYEPYHKPTTTNIYLDEPLRKVGDYADYIDYIRGKAVRNVFYGSLLDIVGNVTSGGMYSATGLCRVQGHVKPAANMLIAPLSRSMKGGTKINSDSVGLYFEDQYKNLYCYFNSNAVGLTEGMSSSEIANAIKQYIQDNEIDIYYVLKTPIEETIELPKIPTHKGTSIITADTTIQPSNAEIEYYSNVKE